MSNAGTGNLGEFLKLDRQLLQETLRLNTIAHLDVTFHFGLPAAGTTQMTHPPDPATGVSSALSAHALLGRPVEIRQSDWNMVQFCTRCGHVEHEPEAQPSQPECFDLLGRRGELELGVRCLSRSTGATAGRHHAFSVKPTRNVPD